MPLESIAGKEEIAGYHNFLLFHNVFYSMQEKISPLGLSLICRLQNAFHFDPNKKLLLGRELGICLYKSLQQTSILVMEPLYQISFPLIPISKVPTLYILQREENKTFTSVHYDSLLY